MSNIGMDIFLAIWTVLDMLFTFIDNVFASLFDGIPTEAIPFLIAIFCYSVLSFVEFFLKITVGHTRRILLRIFYITFLIIVVLITLWRFGFIILLDYAGEKLSPTSITVFVVNMVYIIFAIVLFITFYKKVPWLKVAIVIIMWVLFLLITFIIVPAQQWSYTDDSITFTSLSSNTLFQVLFMGSIFVIPRGLNRFKDAKNEVQVEDGDYEDE